MAERIVLFGGTFDPVHHGHLIVARAVAERCRYGRITLLPAASPPHKALALAPAGDRLAMIRLAIEGEELFDVCDLELRRDGPSYTIDTVAELRRLHGPDVEIRLLVGADMLEELPRWRRARELVELVGVTTAARPPWQRRMEGVLAGLGEAFAAEVVQRISRSVVDSPLIDISSTEVRRRVAAWQSIRYLVPDAVISYIDRAGLYRAPR